MSDGSDWVDPGEGVPAAARDQTLIEGPIGESGWGFRTARMPGWMDFFPPEGEAQPVQAAGAEIVDVRVLHDSDEREVLVLTEKMEHLWRRDGSDKWVEQGNRSR